MTRAFSVTGMTCGGCVRSVERVVTRIDGVEAVRVELEGGKLEVDGNVEADVVIAAVVKAGFEAASA